MNHGYKTKWPSPVVNFCGSMCFEIAEEEILTEEGWGDGRVEKTT
jgi:hypothetical protein